VLAALSLAVLGGRIFLPIHMLFWEETGSAVGGVSASAMQNLRGELVLLFGDDTTLVRQCALAALRSQWCFYVGYGFSFTRKLLKIEGKYAFRLLASVSILMGLAFSVHAHTQDYLIAAVPCMWLFQYLRVSGKSKWLSLLLISFAGTSWLFFLFLPVFNLLKIQPFFFWDICCTSLALQVALRCHVPKSNTFTVFRFTRFRVANEECFWTEAESPRASASGEAASGEQLRASSFGRAACCQPTSSAASHLQCCPATSSAAQPTSSAAQPTPVQPASILYNDCQLRLEARKMRGHQEINNGSNN